MTLACRDISFIYAKKSLSPFVNSNCCTVLSSDSASKAIEFDREGLVGSTSRGASVIAFFVQYLV